MQQPGSEDAACCPQQYAIREVGADVVDLRDQHDVGAKGNHAQQQQRLSCSRQIAFSQTPTGSEITSPQKYQQYAQPGEFGHGFPVGGNKADQTNPEQ